MILSLAGGAARAGTTSGTVNVAVVERFGLVKTGDLSFGDLAVGATGGTVIVTTAGARSSTGGVVLYGGSHSPAAFSGFGNPNRQVIITFGAPSILITRSGGSQTMTVDSFTPNPTGSGGLNQLGNSGRHRITTSTGLFTFNVGARLIVAGSQTPGTYSGTFSVTVNYQ